jgi:hypothetical protein
MSRETPYWQDNATSKRRKMARPKDLLAWYITAFREEVPDRLHTRGVWVGKPPRQGEEFTSVHPKTGEVLSKTDDLVGGSHIGSPRMSDPFRAFLEDDAFGTEAAEYEGHKDIHNHYRTPMRAALARLAGRGHPTEPYPFMARALYRTALNDGDWDYACASLGIIEPVRKPYIEAALHRLFERYHEEPPQNYYRDTEAVA